MEKVWQKRVTTKKRLLVWILLSLVGAVGAAWSGTRYLAQKAQELEHRAVVPVVQRLVASQNLAAGKVLHREDLAIRDFPSHLVNSDSLSPEQFFKLSNQTLVQTVATGDLILPAHVRSPEPERFSKRLQPGRRAFTLSADVFGSVVGLLSVGDVMDVYVSFDHQKRRITAPLLQAIRILAIHRPAEYGGGEATTLTLDVSPEEGVKLLAARQVGTLTAMLRSTGDEAVANTAVRGDLVALLGMTEKVASAPHTIPILYGNQPSRLSQSLVSSATVPAVHALLSSSNQTDGWVSGVQPMEPYTWHDENMLQDAESANGSGGVYE